MNVRLFLTGLALGILLTVFAFLITRHSSRITPSAQAIVGTLDISGTTQTITGDITAARIVDSANSSYFIDPAAAGTSMSLAGNASMSGSLTMASNQPFRPAFGPVKLDYKSGPDAYTTGLIIQDTTGNVGIGTTTPGTKLEVAGAVKSTSGGFTFPDGTTQTSAATGMTSGMIAFFASSCPSGWAEYTAARGMYIVGNPLSGTLATAVGTALTNLENRAVGQHSHTGTTDSNGSHSHTFTWSAACCGGGNPGGSNNDGGSAGTSSAGSHTHTFTTANAGSVAGTNAPYIQLTACQKS